jgi:UDP-N-acetylglucosamine--N-acetylmuramyl-(pentapeptide) pyrophosphoryl-undecaprenol N-acetylglucosamine transferase
MKIVIIGGHLTPALAVIDALPKDSEIIFYGRKYALEGNKTHSLEYSVVTSRKIPFIAIDSGRLQRTLTRYTYLSLIKIPKGFFQALLALMTNRPDVVLGFGSYLSLPIGLAAKILHVPLVIHEQTLNAGLANKLLSFFADKICISWQQSAKYFPKKKTILTGNPIRKWSRLDRDPEWKLPSGQISNGKLPLIYITGGSTGSHAINVLIEGCLEQLLERVSIVHQTGETQLYNDYKRLLFVKESLSENLRKRYLVTKFVQPYKVGVLIESARLVISRSGMNTVTELLSFGKPCLLIPLPCGQKNEQLHNAQFVKKTGIGEYLLQNETDSQKLFLKIINMLENNAKYLVHSNEAKSLVYDDSSRHIVKIIYDVYSKTK